MLMKMKSLWIALIIIREVLSFEKGYYTIIAPGNVRSESIFHVSFTLNEFHKSCWFNITLTSYNDNHEYRYDSIEVKPGTTKLVELYAPYFDSQIANLDIYGYKGIISKDSDIMFVYTEPKWMFIQTNKIIYKPGDEVEFRVIYIDQLKRPAKINDDKIITVEILDDESNIIMVFYDIKFVQGVFKGKFQLSDYPVLGDWYIELKIDGDFQTIKKFEVDRYNLPKFNVQINTKEQVSIYDKQLELEISTSYFYGEPVKGNLSLNVFDVYYLFDLTRKVQIDGKAKFVFDLEKDFQLRTGTYYVKAILIDDLSEEQSWAFTEIHIHDKFYKIEVQVPRVFYLAEVITLKVKVLIKDFNNNLIEDIKDPIEIIVLCREEDYYSVYDSFRMEYKTQIGQDFSVFNITNNNNKNYTNCFMHAEYQKIASRQESIVVSETPLRIEILTESPEEGKKLEIEITYPYTMEEFSYEIVSKRDIIQSGHVNVPGKQKIYILCLNVTFEMVPKITIYIHFIQNMNFIGQFKDVRIKRAFRNSIEIKTDSETNPGKSIYINVTTDKGSYVGLMGIDRRALENIVDEDKILNEDKVNSQLSSEISLKSYNSAPFYGRSSAGVITFSNVIKRPLPYPPRPGAGRPGPKVLRKHFPESWLFMDFEMTPEGSFSFMENTPDTITTWAITGFSIHPETGLTFTKNITDLKVFQKFFLSFDLPSLVKEGEIIEVPIYLSNYLNQAAMTNVTILSETEGLEILEDPEAIPQSKQSIVKLIPSKKREKILFYLKPLKTGEFNVTVKAISSMASDAVQKILRVQSQGVPHSLSKRCLVHLPKGGAQNDEITLDIPEDAVPGSQKVEVTAVGDIFRPLMKTLEKRAKVPYGNGEENMRFIISNCLVLKYLKTLDYSNPSLEKKLKLNILLGYQNQLSFKYLDGSFGLFDRKTIRSGNFWQTAFALWGLNHANDFIRIDFQSVQRGFEYLASRQLENGCFGSKENTLDDVKLTAFGLMVFIMDDYAAEEYNEVITKGLECLNGILDDLEYSPANVMSKYVFLLAKHERADTFFDSIVARSGLKNKQKLWTKSDTLQSHLEITVTSLISLFESQNKSDKILLHIVRGLILSKEEETSSTNYMVALNILMTFLEDLPLGSKNLNITFNDDQNKSGNFQINSENSKVLQKFEVSQNARKINFQSKGQGFAVIDVKYKYNLLPKNLSSSFFTMRISSEKTSKLFRVLKVCSSLLKNNTKDKLTIMEIDLQSGYTFNEKDSKKDEDEEIREDIKAVEFNDNRDKVVVYFDFVESNEVCIELKVRKTYKVFYSKSGWVSVYGVHDRDRKAVKSFRINEAS